MMTHSAMVRWAMWLLLGLLTLVALPAQAALTVAPITWNIIGLDSNNVSVGPNKFPVGARICSNAATTVTATFNWDDGLDKYTGDLYINLRTGTKDVVTLTFPGSGCQDAYFEVEINRNSSAYEKTRRYYITATDVSGTVSTPRPRELFVEYLISQSRNSVNSIQYGPHGSSLAPVAAGGTMTLMVGQEYDIQVVSSTATQGYEQSETFIGLPNTIFQLLSVSSGYSADSSENVPNPNDKLYGDACNAWEANPLSPNYPSCQSTGKVGGTITQLYHIKILSVPGAPLVNPEPLSTLIYDYSGSSFHYNADFGVSTRYAQIISPATITKAFSPNTIAPNENSTLTYSIKNISSNPLSNLNFADTDGWPAGMTVNSTIVDTSGCGSPSPTSLSIGAESASFSNITVAANSTCTISITVTAGTNGNYPNTTQNLFIGTLDTGSKASATLVVSSSGPNTYDCGTTKTTLVTWNFDNGGTVTNPNYTGSLGTGVSSASATAVPGTGTASLRNTTFGGGTGNSTSGVNYWQIENGWQGITTNPASSTMPYFQFQVDTSNYSNAEIRISYILDDGGAWANVGNNRIFVHTSNGSTWTDMSPGINADKGSWIPYNYNKNGITGIDHIASGAATGTSTTTFRVNAIGAKLNGVPRLALDDVTIVGCLRPTPPTLSKAFSPATIGSDSTDATTGTTVNYTTLTFTIGNTNAGALTGVEFTDTLPDGLVVANPSGASTTCNPSSPNPPTATVTATEGSNTISLSGGYVSAGSGTTCTVSVNVQGKVAGSYTNTSSRISAPASGPNTTGGVNVGYGQASLTVINPPFISKAFGTTNILTGTTTSLQFTITNPNPTTALSGVAFTDNLPSGLTVVTASSSVCGGSLSTIDPTTISFSGGSLTAGSSCTLSVTVTGTIAGSYTNTTGAVSSTEGGTGNTASAKVLVRPSQPKLSLKKQVGTTASGPWYETSTIIASGSNVYYRFIVENTGDVDLTSININDPDVSTSGCTWPSPLLTANADGTEVATCVVGTSPTITAISGTKTNTAYATGTYSGSSYNSPNDSATYQNGNFGHLPVTNENSSPSVGNYVGYNTYNDGGAFHLNGDTKLGRSVTTTATDGPANPYTYYKKSTDDGVSWTGNWTNNTGHATIIATCTSGTQRTVYGWFDWNNDGDFMDTNEVQSWTVNCGSGGTSNLDLPITFPTINGNTNLAAGTYYARFRIYDTAPSSYQPYGIAKDASGNPIVGEIEDYQIISDGSGGTPTYALLSDFRAYALSGVPVIEWRTAGEIGTVGFDLYRKDVNQPDESAFVPLNAEMLPALIDAPQGGAYYFVDPSAQIGQTYTYRLVEHEVDAKGEDKERNLGIYTVLVETRTPADADITLSELVNNYAHKARAPSAEETARSEAANNAKQEAKIHKRQKKSSDMVKLYVKDPGLYRVDAADLATLLSIDLKEAQKQIGKYGYQLTSQGRDVAYHAADDNSALYFYNPGYDSVYTSTNVFWLGLGKKAGVPMAVVDGVPSTKPKQPKPPVPTGAETFQRTLEFEENDLAALGGGLYGPEEDYWLWNYLYAGLSGSDAKTYPVTVPAGIVSSPVTLTLELVGGTNTPANPDHHLVVVLNGKPVGETRWDGIAKQTLNLTLNPGALEVGDENTLTLTAVKDAGVSESIFYLDRFTLKYSSRYQAANDRLAFNSAANNAIQISSFSTVDPVALVNLSDPWNPVWVKVTSQAVAGGYGVTFNPASANTPYWAVAISAVPTVENAWTDAPSQLKDVPLDVDYLVIAPEEVKSAAQALADYRKTKGFSTAVVDLEDIMDEFNGGLSSPRAIRDFLTQAYTQWKVPPRFVVLAGAGSYDYQNYKGFNDSLIPPLLVRTPYGLAASDNSLGDVVGNDGLPEIIVGRISAVNNAELQAYVDKVKAYESAAAAPWMQQVVLVADNADGAGDFPKDSDDLAALVVGSSYQTQKIYLGSAASTRTGVLNALNQGAAYFNYLGHGSSDQLADERMLLQSDVADLINGGRLPLALFLTCAAANFSMPGYDALGEALVLKRDGGAIAVWGPTGLSLNSEAKQFGDAFFNQTIRLDRRVLGESVFEAYQHYGANRYRFMLDIYSILGDPALQMK